MHGEVEPKAQGSMSGRFGSILTVVNGSDSFIHLMFILPGLHERGRPDNISVIKERLSVFFGGGRGIWRAIFANVDDRV